VVCGSAAVTERPERTARGYRRFRCRECGKQFNERSGGVLNHTQYPSDVIALVVLWRMRYRLTLRDLSEMFLIRGIIFSHEAVRGGRRSSRRSWPTNSVDVDAAGGAPVAATGMWMRSGIPAWCSRRSLSGRSGMAGLGELAIACQLHAPALEDGAILYCGLDVSLKQTAPCVVGGDGRVVREAKLATDPEVRSKVADPQQQ
jgi:hypothetical protein